MNAGPRPACESPARSRKRRRAPRPHPPLLRRLDQTLLALDVAQASGWAIYHRGEYLGSGTCSPYGETALQVVKHALLQATSARVRLAVVAERAWGRRSALEGLAAAWGAWRAHLTACSVGESRVVRVWPSTWMAAVLPKGWNKGGCSKGASMARAAEFLGRAAVDDNESDAVCIGLWALQGASG